ncbi:deoxyribonuclease-2-alpha isoform X2 [Fopius arisanus]|uniref:Deoxyribonuclease-2-alpha isoform X2 n=1 Tax=Fopius arisanus TaxID=64838 RepID=A0A9R1U230_9HYME|nr:PREDICTED: deoxyribonuclease-2-alpha-like isoform X2 [Fopius arisanus]
MENKEYKNWVCVGDINRADTQFNRGGGTVCLNSPNLWKNYRDSVNEIEPCPRRRSKTFDFLSSPLSENQHPTNSPLIPKTIV